MDKTLCLTAPRQIHLHNSLPLFYQIDTPPNITAFIIDLIHCISRELVFMLEIIRFPDCIILRHSLLIPSTILNNENMMGAMIGAYSRLTISRRWQAPGAVKKKFEKKIRKKNQKILPVPIYVFVDSEQKVEFKARIKPCSHQPNCMKFLL